MSPHAASADKPMIDWALRYAVAGFRVFPVHTMRDGGCSCGAAKGSRPGKHPVGALAPHGFMTV
jgi:hypothetical protein